MQVGNAEGHRGHSENSETKHRQRPILHNHILHDRTALLPSIGSETDHEICTSCPVHQLSLVGTKNSIHRVRQAGTGGWSWNAVRGKHCSAGWSWRLELEKREKEKL